MQIDPAALSRTDSTPNPAKGAAPNASSTAKSSRALISVPRLDLEHPYTDLKAAIGDKWAEYKESTALFLLGMSPLRMLFTTYRDSGVSRKSLWVELMNRWLTS